jgi:hypothetical protein
MFIILVLIYSRTNVYFCSSPLLELGIEKGALSLRQTQPHPSEIQRPGLSFHHHLLRKALATRALDFGIDAPTISVEKSQILSKVILNAPLVHYGAEFFDRSGKGIVFKRQENCTRSVQV